MKLEATESMILGSAYGFRLQEELLRCRLWALFGIRVDANLAHGHCDRSIVMRRRETKTKTEQTRNKRIWETKRRYKRFHTKTWCKNCTAWIASFGHVDTWVVACIAVSTFSGTCGEISGFGSPAAATTGPNASTAICAQKVHTVPTCSNHFILDGIQHVPTWFQPDCNPLNDTESTQIELPGELQRRKKLHKTLAKGGRSTWGVWLCYDLPIRRSDHRLRMWFCLYGQVDWVLVSSVPARICQHFTTHVTPCLVTFRSFLHVKDVQRCDTLWWSTKTLITLRKSFKLDYFRRIQVIRCGVHEFSVLSHV